MRNRREKNAMTATLFEKIAALPEDRTAEIEDFVDFIRQREEQRARNWQTTVEAMQAAERGELVTVGDIDGLLADLHADD
jgi:hypothetical protein